MKPFALFSLYLFILLPAVCQTRTWSGIVTDAGTGEALEAVSVINSTNDNISWKLITICKNNRPTIIYQKQKTTKDLSKNLHKPILMRNIAGELNKPIS